MVDTVGGLAEWSAAWGSDSPFRPELLGFPAVHILVGRRRGEVRALDGDLDAAWAGILSGLPADRRVVGYEAGPALTAATNTGFTRLGPLRVWLAPM